jgi:hypothetical protein
MTDRIAALTHLAVPLVGLLALTDSCKSDLGTDVGPGSGGTGHGGTDTGGMAGAGTGGDVGGQTGSGGSGRGGSAGRGGNGGQGGRSASDAGKGGTTAIDGGAVACDDIESPGRLGVYSYDDSAVSGSSIQLHFDVVNFTAYSSRLQQVTVRYWFTDEDPSSANVMEQYYVPIPTTMKFTTLNPPRTGANTVLEMSFRDAPDAGVSWVETRGFNFAFHKTSYAGTYDQSNDYSYDPKLTKSLGQNPKITAYVNGVLSWGCEPPVQEVVVDAGVVDAGNSPADVSDSLVDDDAADEDAAGGG